jgi:hypothetical protein
VIRLARLATEISTAMKRWNHAILGDGCMIWLGDEYLDLSESSLSTGHAVIKLIMAHTKSGRIVVIV